MKKLIIAVLFFIFFAGLVNAGPAEICEFIKTEAVGKSIPEQASF